MSTYTAATDSVVICLHGCNQNAVAFKSYMKNLERIFKPLKAEFVYLEAKYAHPLGGQTWYEVPLNVSDIGKIAYSEALVGTTLTDVHNVVNKHLGKKIILLGFSQGGNVADAYMAYEYPKHFKGAETGPVKACVVISGYSLLDKSRVPVSVPLINVRGLQDTVVPPALAPTEYHSVQYLDHPDGHIIPKSETTRALLASCAKLLS